MPVVHTYCSAPIAPRRPRGAEGRLRPRDRWPCPASPRPGSCASLRARRPSTLPGDDSAPSAYVEVGVFARGEVPASAWERFTEEVTPVICRELL